METQLMALQIRRRAAWNLPPAEREAELRAIEVATAELKASGGRTRSLVPSEIAERRALAASLERDGIRYMAFPGSTVTVEPSLAEQLAAAKS